MYLMRRVLCRDPGGDDAEGIASAERARSRDGTPIGVAPPSLTMPSGSKNNDFEARLYRAKRNRACDTCRKRKGERHFLTNSLDFG
jgi:hypothetical protein